MAGKSCQLSPYGEGETGSCHTELTMGRGREGCGMIEDMLTYKTTLTVNAITVKAANTWLSQEHLDSWRIHISKHC